ncbi:Speckle-type POZ protein B [Araneus ventricosus]|uniref:Speckle-type POZ protein B n=1 Tax=Araneus ventricosus TaxID=182803 RepID=A0A4Y2VWD5_ARAVE|nr:Speckle-type POZ protein B [Araneus ventricosus]
MADGGGKVLKFIWKVENYSYCWNKTDDFLQSPDFQVDVFEGSSWCLKLYPRGVSSYEKYTSVHLGRLESSKGPLGITVDYEIALLRPDGTAEYVKETKGRCFRKGHAFGFDNLAVREEILCAKKSALLPEDILTVQCRIFPKGIELKSYTEIIAKTHLEVERFVFRIESSSDYNQCYNEVYELRFPNDRKSMSLKFKRLYGKLMMYTHGYMKEADVKALHCKVGILDSSDSISLCLLDKHIDDDICLITDDEILKQKALYLPNNKLTLHCDFTFSFGVQHSQIKMVSSDNAFTHVTASRKVSSEIDIPPKNYSCHCTDNNASFKRDFQNLYQEGTLCDFTLKVGDENIQAHKVVLGARSPVFKAMLTNNMKENEKNLVVISDVDANTVRRMLTFIYTDTTGDLNWETASQLYIAADKYGIMNLKHICANVLERNLCVSNVREALLLSNMHGDDDLKNLTLEFISSHDTEVICSTEWEAFMTEEVHLAAETMRYIFLRKAEEKPKERKRKKLNEEN